MANIGKYPQVDYNNSLKILARSSSRSEAVLFSGQSLFDYLNSQLVDFKNTYYGPLPEDPFQNPSGEPMKEGDLYYNTASDLIRVFNGTDWEDAVQADAYTRAESDERFAEFDRPRDNLVINGGFQVWQRGTSFAASTTPAYCADRFVAFATDAVSGTYERSTDAPIGSTYSLLNNSTTAASVAQAIELPAAGNISPIMPGDKVTFSVWVKSIIPDDISISISLRDSRVSTANLVFVASSTQGALSEWTRHSVTIESFPAANPTNTIIYASVQNLRPGARISGVKMEIGSRPTDFRARAVGEETALCQRYYEVGSFFHCGFGNASNLGSTVRYAVTKRISPTVSQTNVDAFNCSATPSSTPINGGFLSVRTVNAGPIQAQFRENWTADAEL